MQEQQKEFTDKDDLPIKERGLTREQRRFQERINKSAKQIYHQLADKFTECFLANDPESEAVTEKVIEVVAKWKMVCGKMQLNESARGLMQKYCDSVYKDYKKAKD